MLPQAPSIFNDLQTFLNDQGFPQVFSTLTPPSTPSVSTPTDAETKALADPAIFSTVKILGTACSSEQEGSGFVVGPGLVATNAHVVAGESNGNTQVLLGNSAYNATPVLFDPDFDLAVLRTNAPLGPALVDQLEPRVLGARRPQLLGYPEDRGLSIGAAGVTEEVTAIGKDIYNNGSVTRGVYALDASVLPGQFRRTRCSGPEARSSASSSRGPPCIRTSATPSTSPGVLCPRAAGGAAPLGRQHRVRASRAEPARMSP